MNSISIIERFDWPKNKHFLLMFVRANQFCICISVWLVNKNHTLEYIFKVLTLTDTYYAQTYLKKKLCVVLFVYSEKNI